jgi:hypothetical protein
MMSPQVPAVIDSMVLEVLIAYNSVMGQNCVGRRFGITEVGG